MSRILKAYTFGIYAFLYLPLIMLVLYSFNESKYAKGFESFTFKWYVKLFSNDALISALSNSIIIALISSILSILIALPLAYFVNRYYSNRESTFDKLYKSLIIMPDISLAIGLMFIFQLLRFSLGIHTIIITHVTFGVAFAYLIFASQLHDFNTNMYHSARDLGATEWQVLIKVAFPVLMSGILAAFFVCFTLSWDDFVFAFFNSSAGNATLPVQIYAMIKRGINPEINAVATLSMLISLCLIFAGLKFGRLRTFTG